MVDMAGVLPEAPPAAPLPANTLKSGGLPPVTPQGGRLPSAKLPQVRYRRGRMQQVPTREITCNKVAPIWLGSGLKEEIISVKDIKQIVPEEMHHNENVLAIERFEADAGPYEAQKKFVMAAECLEQAINLRRKFLGDMHQDFLTAIERYVISCNLWGIQCLNAGQNSSALELLMKAEGLTEADNVPNFKRRVSLRAATFNNLCCYFRARGKLNAALQFAEKALKIEQRYKDAENPARTHLNYAVLLSMMNRHEESVEHIESATAILHDDERQISYQSSDPQDGDINREEQHQEVVSTLVVAYYNHWVELGRLSRREAGVDCILRAANIAKRKLGAAHPLTIKMEETLGSMQEQLTKAQFSAHALDTTEVMVELPHGEQPFTLTGTSTGLPPLDTRGAWVGARRDEPLKLAVDAPQITVRYQPEPMRPPPPPPGPKPPLSDSLKQLRVKEHVYGRTVHPILGSKDPVPLQPIYDQRPRSLKQHGPAGSPGLLQHAHGVQPMLSARLAREGSRPPPQSPAHVHPMQKQAPSPVHTLQKPQSPVPRPPMEPKPPTEAPLSPYLREAYRYHMEQAAKRKSMDGQEEPDVPVEPDRIRAIGVFKGRLENRRRNGLPTPTESNRIRAATQIQALFRGFMVRQWSVDELAKDVHRQQHLAEVVALRQTPDDANSEIDGEVLPRPGPADMKRRVAFRVVYAARRAFVEYSAAVKLQKLWRGFVTRRDIRMEIVRVATDTATKLQALFRRYSVVIRLVRQTFFATTIQKFWRRALARRRAKRRLVAVGLLTRVGAGYCCRKRLLMFQEAAVPVQRAVRGYLTRLRLSRKHKAARVVQRAFHGWRCRRKVALSQSAVKGRAVTRLAALWRSYAVRKRIRERHAAAYIIQRRSRLSLVKRKKAKMQRAASKIGAAWRGYQLRKHKPYRESACKIQSHFRGVLARERLRKKPGAIVRIQSAWRGHATRRAFKLLVALTMVLQRIAKRRLIGSKLGEVTAAAVLCQRIVRSSRARRRFKRIQALVRRVQAVWRSTRPRRRLIQQEKAAQKLQAFVRKTAARQKFLRHRNAVARIKAAWHAHGIRLAMKELRYFAHYIARCVRGHLARKKLQREMFAATQIQRCWVGHHLRVTHMKRMAAATKIRAALLGRYRQLCYNTFRDRGIIGIQRLWKARKAYRRFKAQQRIARILQNQVRGRQHRKRVQDEYEAATRIQAAWKRVLWRSRIDRRNQCASKIQSAFLAMVGRHTCRQRNKVAVMTQCLVRGYKARLEKSRRLPAAHLITRWMRSRLDRTRFLRKRKAVMVIQDYFRARQTRRRYLKLKRFVTILEADARQHVLVSTCKLQMAGVATIQKCWRRTAAHMRLHRRVAAAVTIQKYVRGWLAVLQARRTQKARLGVTLAMQSHWRRKMEQRRYAKKKKVQELTAGLFRCYQAKRMIKTEMCEPATKIVATAKGHLTSNRLEKERQAAIKIHKVMRGYMARREVRSLREEGPVALQSWLRIRSATETVETKRYYAYRQLEANASLFRQLKRDRREEAAALRLQAFYRMRFQHKLYQKKIKFALPRIQALNRMFLDRDEYRTKKEAAIFIQKSVRAYCTSKLPRQHAAARTIQRVWKRHLVVPPNRERQHFSEFAAQTFAAIHIQTAFRRYSGMWRYLRVLVAAVRIQALMRMHMQKQHWRRQVAAARRIQVSLALIWLAKKEANHRSRCVLKVQAFARRALVTMRNRKMLKSTIRIQANWRGALCRRLVMQRRHEAATKVQAYYRMHLQRDLAYLRRQAALTSIQAHARGFLTRLRIAKENAAAAKIQIRFRIIKRCKILATTRWMVHALQKMWRGRKSRRRTRTMLRLVRIPALARGRLWRRKWIVMVASAIVIQRIWRGGVVRTWLQQRSQAAKVLQTFWRSFAAKRHLRRRRRAVILIQRYRLRFTLRRGSRLMRDASVLAARAFEVHHPVETHRSKIDATIATQRVVRSVLCREHIRHMHKSACTIQKHARSWFARRRVRRRWHALGKIQALVDGAYRRRTFADAMRKVARIQDHYRMRSCRSHFLEKRNAQILIARVVRAQKCRNELVRQKKAADVITKRVRTWLPARAYRRQREAAPVVESNWRGRLDRDELRLRDDAASRIGVCWRRHWWTRKHQARRRAGRVLVGAALMWRQVHLRKRRVNAATKIAAVWRSYCVRVNLQLMNDSASKIQRWWRTLKVWRITSDVAVEILVKAKLIREEYLTAHAIVIQRSFRRWRQRLGVPFRRTKRGMIMLQSHFRRRRAAKHVEFYRQFLGVRVKRYVHKDVILVPDAQGRLTRSRAISEEDNLNELESPERPSRHVDIPRLSERQRVDLGAAVAPIQAYAKWLAKVQRAIIIQTAWRRCLARKMFKRRRANAVRIQAVWRGKLARNGLARARAAAVLLQAHFRRILTMNQRRREHEQQLEEALGALSAQGDEVVQGRRIRAGGSVMF